MRVTFKTQYRNAYQAAILLAPFLLFYGTFLIYPFFQGARMSFYDWPLLDKPGRLPTFIGLSNYTDLLIDPYFWNSLLHSLEFTALAAPTVTVTALALALGLHASGTSSTLLRAIFFSSGLFSVTVVTLIWIMVLNPERGLLGVVWFVLGVSPIDVLGDRRFAMPALVLTTLWWSIGLPMALFLSGLQQIPRALYEAAELDHAGRWTTFRYITWPGLMRTTRLVVFLEVIMHIQVFGQVLLMTRGGPANSTQVLVQYIYESSFRDWRVGYASAASMMLFTLLLGVSLLQFRFMRHED